MTISPQAEGSSTNNDPASDFVAVPRGTVEAFWLLTELTGELSGTRTLGELQHMLAHKLRWLFNFDCCTLAVKESPDASEFMLLELRPGYSRKKDELAARLLPVSDNWISRVLRNSKAYHASNVGVETRELRLGTGNLRLGTGEVQPGIIDQVGSVMLLPLVSGGMCMGTLNFSSRQTNAFDSTIKNIASILSMQLGGHLATILSLEQTRKTLQETKDQLNNRLVYLSQNDAFTGLPNRSLLQLKLEEVLVDASAMQRRVAVVSLEVNQFSSLAAVLNDKGGDQLIMGLVIRLQSSIGNKGFLARSSDSEFTFILQSPMPGPFDFGPDLDQVIEILQMPYYVGENEINLDLSMGFAEFPEQAGRPRELLVKSQSALLQAKKNGRFGAVKYTPDLDISHELLFMESQLRKAIDRNELRVFYQPQYSIDGKEIVGMEALVRWQHPALGMVSPGQFIPLAEKNDLIIRIGQWVLEEACRQSVEWQKKGYKPLKMGVNLSYKQFEWAELLPQVVEILQRTGLSPEYLELELTESLFVQDFESILSKINHLKALGINIALDDFGTGYSSLSYLQKLPIDTLKIDQSFVRNLVLDSSNSTDQTIIEAIINLARGLHMEVIAEGVETVEQLKFLQESGCDRMQGYLFSRPVTATAIELMLRSLNSSF